MLFDTHTHLNDKRFNSDRHQVIQNAYESGVTLMLNVSYDNLSMLHSVSLAKKYDFIYAAVGIHPHYSKNMTTETIDEIKKFAKNDKVVAIGEIGLDYYRDLSPRDIQKKRFEEQIYLAQEINKPIIIHVRDSYDDTYDMVKNTEGGKNSGIIHSYSGSVDMVKKFLDENFYISISGPVTYPTARNLVDVVKYVPLNKLLIETDSPYLTPEPHRSDRNDSSYVKFVAQKIANIKKITFEEVAETTMENGKTLFGIE